jgi:hypothetical protein
MPGTSESGTSSIADPVSYASPSDRRMPSLKLAHILQSASLHKLSDFHKLVVTPCQAGQNLECTNMLPAFIPSLWPAHTMLASYISPDQNNPVTLVINDRTNSNSSITNGGPNDATILRTPPLRAER